VRLAHRYAKDEDPVLSLPAVVDLSQLVQGHSLLGAQEIALTGGGTVAARTQRLKWRTAGTSDELGADANPKSFASSGGGHDGDELSRVTLRPMEIKTFRLELIPTAF
ncbi:unnamed protein product, partial [Hapterophycus canaliculatus]